MVYSQRIQTINDVADFIESEAYVTKNDLFQDKAPTSLRQPLKLVAFLRCQSLSACSPVCSDTPARNIDLCTW